ncbi:MAG: GH92 family glycosyl hydrolase [Chitinophagaceae bacterium]
MNRKIIYILTILIWSVASKAQSKLPYVQPLCGTAPSTTVAALKHSEAGSKEMNANTIPAVTLPFAMTQWTPQTRANETKCIPPYYYRDSLFSGFRATHWISGSCMQDYGSFTIMPVVGSLKTDPRAYAVPFSHENETATATYYKLVTKKIIAEVSPTLRGAVMQFTMLRDDSLYLLITPNSDEALGIIKADAGTCSVSGENPVHRIYQGWGQEAGFSGWFYAQIDRPFGTKGSFSEAGIHSVAQSSKQKGGGVYVGFRLRKGEKIVVRAGTSFSSIEGAKANLLAEVRARTLSTVRKEAEQIWEKALSKITVETNDAQLKRIFYTALYHSMQHPRLYSDADGTYPAFATGKPLQQADKTGYFDDFSMWDIYRAQLPLVEILDTSLSNAFIRSLIAKGKQGGWLPIFPCWNSYTAAMIGDHVTAAIASAYNKGIRNYNVEDAYALMRKNAFESPEDINVYRNGMGRRALGSYLEHGFIPVEDSVPDAFHKKEQVSRTLEYAYDDYALATLAAALHKTNDHQLLLNRSLQYKNILDTATGLVRGKHSNGKWTTPFNPDERAFFITEGTPRQYTFYVPHDIPGLRKLMGGRKAFENALDSLFLKEEYWHGNEPGHQIPFLYNYTAAPHKTQEKVNTILKEEYTDGPGGLSGNDDAGQMSAWYVFAAIGFYPVDPVSGNYQLCTPLFDNVTIAAGAGKKVKIKVHRKHPQDRYIHKVQWNGSSYEQNFITHSMLSGGGQLDIWLEEQPGTWGSKIENEAKGITAN